MEQKSSITVQLNGRQGLCQGLSEKSQTNANTSIGKLSTYLKTRGGLWRLLACFPGNITLEEAISQAPAILTKKGGNHD